MSEQELRSALATLTRPAEPPGSVADVLDRVRRRRSRRRSSVAIGAAAAAALVAATLTWAPWARQDPAPAEPASSGTTPTGAWSPIAPSPLSPRTSVASVWTGTEMLVVGGTSATCADGGDCAGPTEDQLFSDGAAYDPATDSWRPITEAPVPVLGFVGPVWTGSEMVVLTPDFQIAATGEAVFTGEQIALAYDPESDAWRGLPDPPAVALDGGIWAGDRIVYWHSDESMAEGDWSLDPSTRTWSELPDDPLPPSFDRSMAWDGSQLLLAALPNVDDPGVTFRVASLDLGSSAWTELPASPVTFGGQQWFAFDGALVNPLQEATGADATASGALDLASGTWGLVPQGDGFPDGCRLPAIGAAGSWLTPGGPVLLSLNPAVAVPVPACDGQQPAAAVWTGSELVAWGGVDSATGAELTADGWTWTPPAPGQG